MSEQPSDPAPTSRTKPDGQHSRRDERRAAALKANMGRRKAQAKARVAGTGGVVDKAAGEDNRDE